MFVLSNKIKNVAILALTVLLIGSAASSMASSGSSSSLSNASHSNSLSAPPRIQKGEATGDTQGPSSQSSILDTIEKLFRICAYIVGVLWVYFNFWKGRTYRPRIEPMITGQLLNHGKSKLTKIVIKVKNVGLSKVDIEQRGTALRLLSYHPLNVNDLWKHQYTIPILAAHKWIEPGETVGEHILITFSEPNLIAVKAEVILVSKKTMWESAIIIT